MGNRCCRRKKYQTLENEAERALEELKREVEEAENDAKKLDALARLGSTYHDQRKFQEAIQYHKEVLEIAKRVENEREEARAYANLGNAYRSRGDFKNAFDNHEKAREIAERNELKDEKIDAYGDLGTDYYCVGDFTKARQNHRTELHEATASLDKAREGRAYSHLGTDQFCFKEYEEAIEHHIKHLMIAEKLGDKKEEGNALGNIGIGLRKTGKFDEAKKYHEKELALAKKTKNKVTKVNAYLNLGSAHRGLTNFRRARIYHWWGSYLAEEDAVKGDALYKLGRDLECMGYLEDAAKKYQSSVEVYNKMRRSLKENDEWAVSFRNSHQKAYTALWRTLSNLHKSKEALFAAEQGRAQALVDLLHLRHNVKEKDHSHDAMRTYLSGEIETQTVFFAIESNKIKLWVFGGIHKEEIEFRQKELNVFTVLQRLVKSAHDQTTAARNRI